MRSGGPSIQRWRAMLTRGLPTSGDVRLSVKLGHARQMARCPKVPEADIATASSERSAFSWLPCRWRVIGRYLFNPGWPNSECMVPCTCRDGISVPDLGRTGHEIVVKLCRALSCRYPVNCIAVLPERYGNVANRNRLRHPASWHHGRSAEAGGKATKARSGDKHSCNSPDIANRSNANRSNASGCARFSTREACQA